VAIKKKIESTKLTSVDAVLFDRNNLLKIQDQTTPGQRSLEVIAYRFYHFLNVYFSSCCARTVIRD